MASFDQPGINLHLKYSLEEISDLVDSFVMGSYDKEDAIVFWKKIFSNVEAQVMYANCLIYKYISFSYGLGHKPLKEARRMIKNITTHPGSAAKLLMDTTKMKGDDNRSSIAPADISPTKKNRERAQSAAGRNKIYEPRVISTGNRNSLTPQELLLGQPGKYKRKGSDAAMDDGIAALKNQRYYQECEKNAKIRELIYTIAYLINACDFTKWNFNSLREVYLVWNKATSWKETQNEFEQMVLKKVSRPPEPASEIEAWMQALHDALRSCNNKREQRREASSLEDKNVGNSVRYATLRHKLRQDPASTRSMIKAIICMIEKMYKKEEEGKILSLLHIFCETVVMAPHVPVRLLQCAYNLAQKLLLMPLPVSAAVRDVLDLIQVEMKSPGYFRKTLFSQENEIQLPGRDPHSLYESSPTNVFFDQEKECWENLQTALANITQTYTVAPRSIDEKNHQRLLIEHTFQCVFGNDSCDIETLHTLLENCSEPSLSHIYSKAMSVMEKSASMEDPAQAQEYIRQELEVLSESLVDEREGQQDTEEEEDVIGELLQQANAPSSSSKLCKHKRWSKSFPSLSPVIAPPRISSFLSRTASTVTDAMEFKSYRPPEDTNGKKSFQPACNRMDYAQVVLRNFDKNQLSDAIFDLVKTTAKEFVAERRRSSGAYSAAQRRYLEKKRSSQLSTDDVRDSGLLEDFSESEKSQNASPKKATDVIDPNDHLKTLTDADFSRTKRNVSTTSPKEVFSQPTPKPDDTSKNNESYNSNILREQILPSRTILPRNSHLRRSRSSGAEFPPVVVTVNPPVRSASESTPDTGAKNTEKSSQSRIKKPKHWFRTIHRKRVKMMRALHKSSNVTDDDFETAKGDVTVTSKSKVTFGEKEGGSKAQPRSKIFSKKSDVSNVEKSETSFKTGSRKKQPDPVESRLARAFSEDCLESDITGISDEPIIDVTTVFYAKPNENLLSVESNKFATNDDNKSRNRMDSGILADKSSDDTGMTSPVHSRTGAWEDAGVAGVRFTRKPALKRSRKGNRSFVNQHSTGGTTKKKVLKLAFIGNDKTIGEVARAYYELRRRQVTRAPLLKNIDLKLYYIPVGDNAFSDETFERASRPSCFDLKIADMLGRVDPWYKTTVTMSANNLLRVRPTIYDEDVAAENEMSSKKRNIHDGILPTVENIFASSLLSYFRFAIKTFHVPLFKCVLKTSTDETITEVFCCRAELGHVAYKQAIEAGRFGKLGKLVDLNNDSGPPPVYTTFSYKKFGLHGAFVSNKTLDETHYYRVTILPIALSSSQKDQGRFPGADGLHVTLHDDDKRMKLLKRGAKATAQEEECVISKLNVSECRVEVVRPVQGTFAVCLDESLIYTNIKSFEVTRCLAPEYDRPSGRKRKQTITSHDVMSLPLKTFWPNPNLT